jgi:hypothetical protein
LLGALLAESHLDSGVAIGVTFDLPFKSEIVKGRMLYVEAARSGRVLGGERGGCGEEKKGCGSHGSADYISWSRPRLPETSAPSLVRDCLKLLKNHAVSTPVLQELGIGSAASLIGLA